MTDGDLPAAVLGEEIAASYRHGHSPADRLCIYANRQALIAHIECAPCKDHRTAYPAKETAA